MHLSQHLRITFHLDGSGLMLDPAEPIHLDALLHWVIAPYHITRHGITRDDEPECVPLPLAKTTFNGVQIWRASALFTDGVALESLSFWRKRLREHRIELTAGSPNRSNGTYRDWQMPVHLTLCHRLIGYATGNRREILRALRRLTHLGKKRAHGYGKIRSVEVERIDEDRALVWEGRAMRWLPDPREGARLVRPVPPYWSRIGRVRCCEVGDPAPLARVIERAG